MGSFSCKVKFSKYHWKRSGYAEVMNSSGTQSMLANKAKQIESACNATFTPSKNEGKGYATRQWTGTLAKGYTVGTQTPHAHVSERKHNRLASALGGL